MNEIKKYGYFSIIVIYIITAITSVLEIIYIAGEYCFDTKLLPESIWDFLDTYFYYEALPFRIMIAVAILAVLSILLFVFYRKNISNATAILSSTMPIVSAIGWTSHYWISNVTDKADIGYIIISVICIIHIVATGVFLIKDKEEFDYM
ncbi:MAG: hypothetical protein IKV25_07495 [Clostridia bacterium]|nr:hypothetical protein [Clostridia bacterium]